MDENLIKTGSFGTVERYKIGDRTYALKRINKDNFSLIELMILSRIDSKYVIKSLLNQKYKITDNEYSFKMEIKYVLDNFLTMSYKNIKEIITGCVYGLNCLHKKGFLHLDIKPDNIFYTIKDSVYIPVLGDFGLSSWVEDSKIGVKLKKRGSYRFMPYEVITKTETLYLFTEKSDIWSLGITFYSCLFYPLLLSRKKDLYVKQIDEIIDTLKFNLFRDYFSQSQTIVVDEDLVNEYRTKSYNIFKSLYPDDTKRLVNDIKYYIEIDNLYKLLISMMQKDPRDRISSDCLTKMSYIDKNLESSCLLADDEQYIIPYIDVGLFETTMKDIMDYFGKNSDYDVKILFMSIEILVKILSLVSNECISEKESIFCKRVNTSDYSKFAIEYALSYYDKIGGNDMISYLNDINIIGYNRVFSECDYLEELLYIYVTITTNYKLFSIFNVMNVKEVVEFIRNEYDYEMTDKNVTCYDFFSKLEKTDIKNIQLPVSVNNSDIYSISNDTDYKFRKVLYNIITPLILEKFDNTGIDYISLLKRHIYTDNLNTFLFENLDKVISMLNNLNQLVYSENKISILLFDNIDLRNPNDDILEISNNNVLINTEKKEMSLVTYFNGTYYQYYYKNDSFKNFCETNGYSYNLMMKSIICKTDLACILYSIYIDKNIETNIVLNDKTIITLLLFLFVDN